MGSQRVRHDWVGNTHRGPVEYNTNDIQLYLTIVFYINSGNKNKNKLK